MERRLKKAIVLVGCVVLLLPGSAWAQARRPTRLVEPLGQVWVTPYLGLGFQNRYYDGVVRFSDGSTKFFTVDPGTDIVIGAQVGYRLRAAWTLYGNVATSSPDAGYVENLNLRPDVGLRTTQVEGGVLYDLRTFPVGGKIAPLSIGGGLSLTVHSLHRFTWDGNFIEPSTTSVGVHGLAALDIPLAPKLSLRGQAKLTLSRLARGDLENKIAFAEGGGVTARLDGRTLTNFLISGGVTIRL